MKKTISLILVLILMIPQMAFATDENSDTLLSERNQALLSYLIEQNEKDGLTGDQTAFFEDHPEYVEISNDMLESTENIFAQTASTKNNEIENPVLLEEAVIAVEKDQTTDGKMIETTKTVGFYSDGSYVLDTLKSVGELQPLASGQVTGQNTLEYCNGRGTKLFRTHVKGVFSYNGSNVSVVSKSRNKRVLLSAIYLEDTAFGAYYPSGYNNNLVRLEYTVTAFVNENNVYLDYLNNRVSCNINGKIYKNYSKKPCK